MIRTTCDALLFDLDGVLIDSTPAVTRVWTQWAISHGLDPAEVVQKAHGRPSLATIRDFLPHADHEAENLEVERREIEDLGGVVTLPGARDLLGAIPRDRWTVVTSCTGALAKVRLQAAQLPLPDRLVTADDVKYGKPHPEPYLRGASLLGVAPANCIVVEDVPAGIRAGKAAEARVIACRTTVSDSELERAGADWVLDGCRSIQLIHPTGKTPGLTLELSDTQLTRSQRET